MKALHQDNLGCIIVYLRTFTLYQILSGYLNFQINMAPQKMYLEYSRYILICPIYLIYRDISCIEWYMSITLIQIYRNSPIYQTISIKVYHKIDMYRSIHIYRSIFTDNRYIDKNMMLTKGAAVPQPRVDHVTQNRFF